MYPFRENGIKRSFIACVLSSILFIPLVACAQPGEQLPIGEFKLNIATRPSAPYPALLNYNSSLTASGTGSQYTVQVSRHHIIPFNVLREFYNKVSEKNAFKRTSSFFKQYANTVRFYAANNGIDCNSLGNDLLDAGNLAQSKGYGLVNSGGSIIAPGFDTFEQFYVWLPGNLFIGPNNRSDDPHEGFESNAGVVVGATTFDILKRLYNNMLRYNNGDDSVLNSISADLTQIAQRRSVYPLKSSDWEYVNGQYRLSTQLSTNSTEEDTSLNASDQCSSQVPTMKEYISTIFE